MLSTEEIKTLCDKHIRAKDRTKSTVAINAMHFLSHHPAHMARFRRLMSQMSTFSLIKDFSKKLFRLARLVSVKKSLLKPKIRKRNADILVFSHINHFDHFDGKEDFYFGDLRCVAASRGLKVRYIYLDKTTSLQSEAERRFVAATESDYLILNRVWFISFYRFLLDTITEAVRLRRLSKKVDSANEKLFLSEMAKQCTDYSTIRNLGIWEACLEAISESSPDTVICTYEGHAFERLLFGRPRTSCFCSVHWLSAHYYL